MRDLAFWGPLLAVSLVSVVLIRSAFDVAGQFQAQRDLANTERDEARAEVRRLKALVESRTQQLGLWMTRAFEAGWQPMLREAQAERVMRDLFTEPVRREELLALPPWLVIGTPSHPIVLDRTYCDSSLNDTAVASTLEDLVRSTGGRLA